MGPECQINEVQSQMLFGVNFQKGVKYINFLQSRKTQLHRDLSVK